MARRLHNTTTTAIRLTKTITNMTMPAIRPALSIGITARVAVCCARSLVGGCVESNVVDPEIAGDDAVSDGNVNCDDSRPRFVVDDDASVDVDLELVVVVPVELPPLEVIIVAFPFGVVIVTVVGVLVVIVVVVFGVAIPHTRHRTPRHCSPWPSAPHWRSCARPLHPVAN